MTDYGLLLSMALTLGLPALFTWRWPLRTCEPSSRVTDIAIPALAAGLLVGRAVNLLIDDPRSLTRLGDFLIIRSGVEFWAGVVAGLVVVARAAHRDQVKVLARLADIAPAALVAQAGYHLTCVVRDGCYGPRWAPGPTPKGLSHGMLPVELLAGGLLIIAAIVLASSSLAPRVITGFAVFAIAAERSVASLWLPRLGTQLTRQHRTSVALALLSAAFLGMTEIVARRRSRTTASTPSVVA